MTHDRLFTGNTTNTDIARQFVARHYDSLEGHTVQVFKDGFDHAVVVVDDQAAYRFPKNQEYLEKLPVVSRFLSEFAPQSPVAIPVSEIFTDGTVTYEKYAFLPGKPLYEDRAATFSHESLKTIAADLGSFLTALHAFPVDRALSAGVPLHQPLAKWQGRYEATKQFVLPALPPAEAAWVTNVFTDFMPLLPSNGGLRVTHFDVKPDHIIVDSEAEKLVGIIDFGDMEIGDPAYDFTFFGRYGAEFVSDVLDAYRGEKDQTFVDRVKCYQNLLPVMDLDHAIQIGATDKVDELRQRLSRHIARSHLVQ